MRVQSRDVVALVALLAATAYASWLWARHTFELGAEWTDGDAAYESLLGEGIRYAVWEDPRPLGGAVNGEGNEHRPALSPDGRLLVFASGERGLNADLWMAELGPDGPRDPRPLDALNSTADELAPAFGPDAMYFATDRSGSGGLDLWRAPYADGAFGRPEPLLPGANGAADETDPCPLPGGGLLFASNRARGARDDFDLYRALPAPTEESEEARAQDARLVVAALDALNTPFDEREPAVTRDGRALFFASDRAGTRGGFDLFRSFHEDGQWLAPSVLAGVNGPGDERGPLPSADGFALYFDRAAQGLPADLVWARSKELFRLPPAPIGWREAVILLTLLLLALFAWLAKRWSAMEVLYRCFLVSLLVHLLFLWMMREVFPTSEEVALGDGEHVFRVRLAAAAAGTHSADRERAGQLETAPSPSEAPRSPERLEPSATREASSAPEPREAQLALDGPEREQASAPGRGALALEPAGNPEPTPSLTDREERSAPSTAPAPGLALAARTSEALPSSPASVQPRRSRAAAAPTASADDRPATDALPVAVPATRSSERGAALTAARLERASEAPRPAVSLAQPAENLADRTTAQESPAPVLALGAARPTQRTRSATAAAGPGGRPARPGLGPAGAAADALVPSTATPLSAPARPDEVAGPPAPERRNLAAAPTSDGAPPTQVALRTDDESAPRVAASEGPRRFDALADLAPSARKSHSERAAPASPSAPRRAESRSTAPPERPLEEPARLELALAPAPAPASMPGPDRGPSRLERTPYKNRFGDQKLRALEDYGGGKETERAVAAGLEYLASIQGSRGAWGSRRDLHDKYGDVRIGKTGLALLAFLGAGHTPHADSEHAAVTARAIDFLLSQLDRSSGHFGDSSSYGHGIATYALAECYALTQDEVLRPALTRAVGQILAQQSDRADLRFRGGWGYYFHDGHVWNGDVWPRASVTAWQVMALESARLGGLNVPDEAFQRAREFLANAWDEEREAFRYSHDPARLGSGYPILPGSTPASLFALSLLGVDLAASELADARRFVLRRRPRGYRYEGDDAFVYQARGNLYFWYYGTLAMFRSGKSDWRRWNEAMKETLLPSQEENGSWEAISVYAAYAGDDDRDRSYSTALCVLTLEVYYRYFTPLLQVR